LSSSSGKIGKIKILSWFGKIRFFSDLSEKEGRVQKELWINLLKWYSPLSLWDAYHTNVGNDTPKFCLEEIIEIVAPR
jgi:hypothetical protein